MEGRHTRVSYRDESRDLSPIRCGPATNAVHAAFRSGISVAIV